MIEIFHTDVHTFTNEHTTDKYLNIYIFNILVVF